MRDIVFTTGLWIADKVVIPLRDDRQEPAKYGHSDVTTKLGAI